MLRRPPMKKVKENPVPWAEEVPKKKKPLQDLTSALVYADFGRHTCLEVERKDGRVSFIPFDADEGLQIIKMDEKSFDTKYKVMLDYPIERAAKLYLQYATNLGATRDALTYLGKHTQISQGEIAMATARKNAAETKKEATKKPAAEKPEKKATPVKKEAPEKKVATEGQAKVTEFKVAKGKPYSAAQMFKDLILEGKLTDDQIFKKVQDKFGLDDNKSGYVKWYRSNLKKSGIKVPDVKEK